MNKTVKLASKFLSLAEKKLNTWEGEKYLISLTRRYNNPIPYLAPNSPPSVNDVIAILESFADKKLQLSDFQQSLIKGRVLKALKDNSNFITLYPEFSAPYPKSIMMPRTPIHISWVIRESVEDEISISHIYVKCSLAS